MAGAGIIHAGMGTHNARKDEKSREKQIAYRKTLKSFIDRPHDLFIRAYKTDKNGNHYVSLAPWIRAPRLDLLAIALTEWAAIPDEELRKIWVNLRYHPE